MKTAIIKAIGVVLFYGVVGWLLFQFVVATVDRLSQRQDAWQAQVEQE